MNFNVAGDLVNGSLHHMGFRGISQSGFKVKDITVQVHVTGLSKAISSPGGSLYGFVLQNSISYVLSRLAIITGTAG